MDKLEEKLGYAFRRAELLKMALTHSSWANENKRSGQSCNERLEFLGDAVLGFTVAEYLYENAPDMPEGQMTRTRAELVCERSLNNAAAALDLGAYLKLGRGEELGGGRERPSILADAFEAVVAAVYLDGGGGQGEKRCPAVHPIRLQRKCRGRMRLQDAPPGADSEQKRPDARLPSDGRERTGSCQAVHRRSLGRRPGDGHRYGEKQKRGGAGGSPLGAGGRGAIRIVIMDIEKPVARGYNY